MNLFDLVEEYKTLFGLLAKLRENRQTISVTGSGIRYDQVKVQSSPRDPSDDIVEVMDLDRRIEETQRKMKAVHEQIMVIAPGLDPFERQWLINELDKYRPE